jgi:hypothetical protein
MSTAGKRFPNVMGIGADVKALAAHNTKFNVRQRYVANFMREYMHEARLTLDNLALAREFVQRNPALFDRGNHRWQLIKVAVVLSKRFLNVRSRELRHWPGVYDFAISILAIG